MLTLLLIYLLFAPLEASLFPSGISLITDYPTFVIRSVGLDT